jgi:hypothetical protein
MIVHGCEQSYSNSVDCKSSVAVDNETTQVWMEGIMLLQSPAFPAFVDWRGWFGRLTNRGGMEFHAANRAIRLEGGQHLKLHDAAGTLVQVVCGAAWITQEGDIKDSFVASGDCFRIERAGETLVAPLSVVSLRLLQARSSDSEAALALLPAGASRSA